MRALCLNLSAHEFDAVASFRQRSVYRFAGPIWSRILAHKPREKFVSITLKCDGRAPLVRPYTGYEIKKMPRNGFGPDPVEVFAIRVGAAL